MATAEELIVALKAEGASETESQIQGVENQMEETAGATEDTADELEGFSQEFQGALTAAVAALAVGAAGLLSQVPVIGEVMQGLFAIVEALAFQMDGVLRPVLSPLTDAFFTVSEGIFAAEGALGDIIGVVTTVVSLAAIAIPTIAAIGSAFGVFGSTAAGIVSILGTVAGVITTVAGIIAGLPVALTAAIAAIVGFAVAYLTNWRGVRDKTNALVSQIVEFVVNGFLILSAKALDALDVFTEKAVSAFLGLTARLVSWASNIASRAYEWGKNIVQRLIDGVQSMLGELRSTLGDIQSTVRSKIDVDVSGGGDGGSIGTSSGLATGGGSTEISIDGRRIDSQTGRFGKDRLNRRGL